MKNPKAASIAGPPRVSERLQALRQMRGLSLDGLAREAGVSKSMLSQIERNLTNPTVALVWRLANALGVSISELLQGEHEMAPAVVVVPTHAVPTLRSPDGKCELRILGPLESAGQFEWYELSLQPGGVLESEPHESGSREHLTVLSGVLEVRSGTQSARAKHGETVRYGVDVPHAIRNPNKVNAVALLVVMRNG